MLRKLGDMDKETPKYPESFTLKLRKGTGEEFDGRVKRSGKTRNGFLNSLIFDRKHNSNEIKGALAQILAKQTQILQKLDTLLARDGPASKSERTFFKDLSIEIRTAIFKLAGRRR